MEFLHSLDRELYRLVNASLAHRWLDDLMLFWSSRWPWFALAAAFVAYAAWSRRRDLIRIALVLASVIAVADLLTYQVLKPAFARTRPCYAMKDVRLVPASCGSDWGFPSNHAANSMGATVVLLAIFPRHRKRYLAFAAPLLIGLSRVYLGVHYPFDVLGGFFVGGAIGAAGYRFAQRSPDKSNTTLGLRRSEPSTRE